MAVFQATIRKVKMVGIFPWLVCKRIVCKHVDNTVGRFLYLGLMKKKCVKCGREKWDYLCKG